MNLSTHTHKAEYKPLIVCEEISGKDIRDGKAIHWSGEIALPARAEFYTHSFMSAHTSIWAKFEPKTINYTNTHVVFDGSIKL